MKLGKLVAKGVAQDVVDAEELREELEPQAVEPQAAEVQAVEAEPVTAGSSAER